MNPEPFHCFYECHKCKRKHRGTEHTPVTMAMVPGTRPNEWVFGCMPTCESYASDADTHETVATCKD